MSRLARSIRLAALPVLVSTVAAACAGGAGGPGGPPPGDAPPAEGEAPPSGEEDRGAERDLSDAERAAMRAVELRASPDTVRMRADGSARVEVAALDSAGERVEGVRIGHTVRGGVAGFEAATATLTARRPGEGTLVLGFRKPPAEPGGEPETVVERVAIVVEPLPVARVEVRPPEGPVYAGTRVRASAAARSEERPRPGAEIAWTSSDTSVAAVSDHGLVQARRPGEVTLTATSEGVSGSAEVRVVENPVRRVEMAGPAGDTVTVGRPAELEARALDGADEPVADAPVEWTVEGPHGGMSEEAYLDEDGVFVAEKPGLFYVTATVGGRSATTEIAARPGAPRRAMEAVGHGAVTERTTSDLWVFQGLDGKDYAYTGTHAAGAGGNVMYAWDVSDPAEPVLTDSVVVDARVVNDVKISDTRELAVITREGASDRANGIVVLDIRVPAHPEVISHHTENLTAGVHNVWIEGDLVYAVNDGTRALHVVDVSDPSRPEQVGRWQIEADDRYLHDVTVEDGLAYLAYWDHGLVILDVGRGIAGGTPTDPALVSRYEYRGTFGEETYGHTHHAVPHGDYVFVGDEIFGCAECVNGPRGYVHVIDVSDLESPEEVAWYRVPEAGAHNLWVEDDRLYVAYYQGGLRVVDVSGELRGDLYDQGREIGWFVPEAESREEGFRPGAAMTWGPQPHDGRIYLSDMNSGLWIVDFADEVEDEADEDGSGAAGSRDGEPEGGGSEPSGSQPDRATGEDAAGP